MSDHDERDLLTRTLRERAAGVGGGSLDLETVRGRARGIKRRRNALRGAVAALVATLAVPGGLAVNSALQTPGDGRPDDNVATRTPSPSILEEHRLEGPTALTLDGLPPGEPPAVSYLRALGGGGADLVAPELTLPLDELGPAQTVVPTGDGWLVLAYPGPRLHRLDRDGDVVATEPYRAGQDLAISADGTHVLYVLLDPADDAQLLTVAATSGATEPVSWRLPARPTVQPVGLADDDTVVYQTTDPRGATTVWTARPGAEPSPVPGLMGAAGAAGGVVYGTTSVDELEPSVCSGAVEAATGDLLWERCGYFLDHAGAVSPSGGLVAAHAGYGDGYGPLNVALLDAASGEPLVEYDQVGRRDQVTALQTVWETDRTLISVLADRGTFALVRLGVDGGSELADGPVDGEPFGEQPMWLSE